MRLVISGRRATYRAPSAMLPKIDPAAAPVGCSRGTRTNARTTISSA